MGLKKIFIKVDQISKLNKRDCFADAIDFLEKSRGVSSRILCLYGLRRTGKTILMQQMAIRYGCDFIYEVGLGTRMSEIYEQLDKDFDNGTKIVFLDEITNAVDFIPDSALLADYYASCGMDVVIAGTDSLGLYMAEDRALFDRTFNLPMTYVSFAEHCRVLNTRNIDEYIQYGGLMHRGMLDKESITDIMTARRYLDSAVAENIVRSIRKNADGAKYDDLFHYSLKDLCLIMQRFVELHSGRFTEATLNDQIGYPIVGAPISDKISHTKDKSVIKKYKALDKEAIRKEYKDAINISVDLERQVTERLIGELEKALFELDLFSLVSKRPFFNKDGKWTNLSEEIETFFIQPAIKYYHLTEAKRVLLTSGSLNSLTDWEREELANQIDNNILGNMTEDIVLFDTMKILDRNKYTVCKPVFEGDYVGEIDMLIRNREANNHYAFEIKHTASPFYGEFNQNGKYVGQDKHLVNQFVKGHMDRQFGERVGNYLLYNGEPFVANTGTVYLNVADFLLTLDKHNDAEKAIEEMADGIRRDDQVFLFNGHGR